MITILISVVVEIILMLLSLLLTIPVIRRELSILNENFKKANETQQALVETVIRTEERLENHIHNTSLHNQ